MPVWFYISETGNGLIPKNIIAFSIFRMNSDTYNFPYEPYKMLVQKY